jgi:CheY-like chemotaxis protein
MRLMCLRSGARIRRADCLKSARRHLQVYRPSVAIIDLGLPDGSGAELIYELHNTTPRVEIIIGTSGDDFSESTAIAAGANGFLPKPLSSLSAFQELILSCLPPDRCPPGPRILPDDMIAPDPIAYRDDMAHIADVLGDGVDDKMTDYVAQFASGVARSAKDAALEQAAVQLAAEREKGLPSHASLARLAGLVQTRLSDRVAM